ncbi:MAG: glutamine-hydrolyzing GMP synthase [Clostridiales bacterium]|jgi:GMP synthase (glutamine-hydrolysing)|nr:glutamine-hydrolyzing GMP synthase [Clostridiales bacterium]
MKKQRVLVLDFGGQYKQLIARNIRRWGVYSSIEPGDISIDRIREEQPIGIILTGGPNSVYSPQAPNCDPALFGLGIPILGICYGMQLMCHLLGGEVTPCDVSEYGQTVVEIDNSSPLFEGLARSETALMSHTDRVSRLPEGFEGIAETRDCEFAAIQNKERQLYGVQFHPEVELTPNGKKLLYNFLYKICGAEGDYSMKDFIEKQIKAVREQVGEEERVLLGLSGGVDSSVCAALLSRAIPNRLICIFVDHGLMRKNEGDEIEEVFSKQDVVFIRVNAQDRFLEKLKGVTDPEKKRKIIGAEFVKVFEEEAKKYGKIRFLAQGTIYPDVIESGVNSANIKSHHNVGGLPEDMDFKELVEPLRSLFKDEVRAVGRQLGLPDSMVDRQPFPGPGLAIRCIGEVTKERLDILREADAIFREEVEKSGEKVQQYFAVLTGIRSVGVMGDERTYDYTVALRAVNTTDFMTCEYAKLPHELLGRVSSRIANEVKGVNRVVYDITGKPPATIEWE